MEKKTETPSGHTPLYDREQTPRETRIHRIGSVTCGISFILFGILFLLQMIVPYLNFWKIFRLWPCIFIMLGIETLIGNYKCADRFIYDKGAVFMLVVLMSFAMAMGIINEWLICLPSGRAF